MVIDVRPGKTSAITTQKKPEKTQITVFHCVNALNNLNLPEYEDCEIKSLKLPCSSLTREITLLKAFEAGADAVVVLTCPEGSCHYLQGNLRVAKRVARVKKLLDEIGLDGHRLNIFHIPQSDQQAVNFILDQIIYGLTKLGPSPARLQN
jgi:F420-non-reducing hydrogenase iron-sulfur subunit